jgi:hypothetical protein
MKRGKTTIDTGGVALVIKLSRSPVFLAIP